MAAIKIESIDDGEAVLLRLSGCVDASTYGTLEDTLYRLFSRGENKIIAEMSELEYMSCAGAGVFIDAMSKAQANRGNVVLLNPAPNVREMFETLGLTEELNVVDDRAHALRLLKPAM